MFFVLSVGLGFIFVVTPLLSTRVAIVFGHRAWRVRIGLGQRIETLGADAHWLIALIGQLESTVGTRGAAHFTTFAAVMLEYANNLC